MHTPAHFSFSMISNLEPAHSLRFMNHKSERTHATLFNIATAKDFEPGPAAKIIKTEESESSTYSCEWRDRLWKT